MAWHRKDAVAAGRVRRSSSSKSPASRRLSRDAPSHAPQPATDDVDVEADDEEDDQNVNSNVNFGLDDPDVRVVNKSLPVDYTVVLECVFLFLLCSLMEATRTRCLVTTMKTKMTTKARNRGSVEASTRVSHFDRAIFGQTFLAC